MSFLSHLYLFSIICKIFASGNSERSVTSFRATAAGCLAKDTANGLFKRSKVSASSGSTTLKACIEVHQMLRLSSSPPVNCREPMLVLSGSTMNFT